VGRSNEHAKGLVPRKNSEDRVTNCGKPWVSDPNRLCEAKAIPSQRACLAHADAMSRRDFLAAVRENPASLSGLLQDLEVNPDLLKELEPILIRFTPINFSRSEFIGTCGLHLHFARDVDFSDCRFRGRASFEGSIFPGEAYFTCSQFDEGASFNKARFDKEARFDLATFSAQVLFGADFRSDVRFVGATFKSSVLVSLRNNIRVLFDDANVSIVTLGGFSGNERPLVQQTETPSGGLQMNPPLVTFHGASFTGMAQIRTRTKVDVSLARIVLRNLLSLARWEGEMRLVSLRSATLEAPLVIGDGVDVGGCRMTHATGLERLRIVEADPRWRTYRRRQVVADEIESVRHADSVALPPNPRDVEGEGVRSLTVNAKTVEAVYRQLRTSLEGSKAFSAAADFYYGEMEMRRLAAPRMSAERVLLALYKLTCGYGVRASRALATYVAVLLFTGSALRYRTAWFVADPAKVAASPGLHFTDYWDSVAIAARYSVTFFGGGSEGWTASGVALMFVVRLIGPAAFAFMLLALRSRVQR
jgi:uncharacterized protein YjbI with pentapeptide repeats